METAAAADSIVRYTRTGNLYRIVKVEDDGTLGAYRQGKHGDAGRYMRLDPTLCEPAE